MSHEEAFSSKPTFPTKQQIEAMKGGVHEDDESANESVTPEDDITPESDDDEESDDDIEINEDDEESEGDDSEEVDEDGPKIPEKQTPIQTPPVELASSIGSDTDDEDDDDAYLQKLDKDMSRNFLIDFHPEASSHNYDEVRKMAKVARNSEGRVVDALHRTNPFLTKYEYTRVLGQRAKQIDSGAIAFVKTPPDILDGYLIAKAELEAKKLPFIIRRPMPGGGFEYWHLEDLELLR